VGWALVVVPLVCAGAGVILLVERERPDPLRTGLGSGLGLIGICGLAELSNKTPNLGATSQVRDAGGWVGALCGHPLAAGIGTAGASVVFVAVVIVAVLIATGISLATCGRALRAAGGSVGSALLGWWKGGALFDEDPEEAPAKPKRRAASKSEPFDDLADEPVAMVEPEPEPEPEPEEEPEVVVPPVAVPVASASPKAAGTWKLPPLSLLPATKQLRHDMRQLDAAGESLVNALAAHGVATRLVGRTVGPSVTRFELELGAGVKVARVTSLSRDIAYAMASPDVRILAPIPGKSAIGVEVPNQTRQLVALRDILDSPEARAAQHPLEVAMGRDIAGRAVMSNLAEMPHILISGATGAGKSSCINSIITSVLMRSTPDQVQLMLIDPKRVELGQYNGLPHWITPVVVDPKKAANALQWAVKEMERRYDLLAEHGMRDITGYNHGLDAGEIQPLGGPSVKRQAHDAAVRALGADHPAVVDTEDEIDDEPPMPERLRFILIVVDELNDLMMVAARDVEDSVVRIAQMARAVGIHLVLATQRPSVDVITGVIKANVPSRMAFSVSSLADSRVILDQPGAERLIGKGDMLLLTASSNIPRRLQAPWVSEEDVRTVVEFWRKQGGVPEPAVGIENFDDSLPGGIAGVDDDDDDLLKAAMDLVVRSQLGSTSMLQRKLRVGFARAGRLMDLLERRGVVGPSEGSKARQVLMTIDELDT
jgi:DNA segregation ATPase FtsK/SpoIIIE, S-DNA-T family